MFAPEYKQPIPRYIRTLGVVTAATGAAVRDIINITGRRNPYVQIILYPAIVQGEAAVPSIINGIHAMEHAGVDTIIVGRGGGSIEDLWAFNDEAVAQAIFDCRSFQRWVMKRIPRSPISWRICVRRRRPRRRNLRFMILKAFRINSLNIHILYSTCAAGRWTDTGREPNSTV